MDNQETFWVVWREGDRGPVVKHRTRDLAREEAYRLSKENAGARFHVLQEIGSVYVDPDPIKQVYEKYRHLDALMCDMIWLDSYKAPQRQCLYDLWQAIKQSQKGKK